MRLSEASLKKEDKSVVDGISVRDLEHPSGGINDPAFKPPGVAYLIYDDNNETIISRTATKINEGRLNPFEANWMEITLYKTSFVKQLLEIIHSDYLMDVAQAIDDEEARREMEDGQYTQVASNSYGTGQGSSKFYSYTIDNWNVHADGISAKTLAEGILDKRKKAEAYRKKIKDKKDELTSEAKGHTIEIIDDPESHLHIQLKESIINQNATEDINALRKERDELEKKYEELKKIVQARTNEVDKWHRLYEEETKRTIMVYSLEEECDRLRTKCEELEREKEAEKAFNATTGATCFTSRQMGILMQAIGYLTEEKAPGKTTLGEVIEKISGYKAITVNQNMKGTFRDADKKVVAKAIESKFPKLAAKVRQI